jgi:hypothetical protein
MQSLPELENSTDFVLFSWEKACTLRFRVQALRPSFALLCALLVCWNGPSMFCDAQNVLGIDFGSEWIKLAIVQRGSAGVSLSKPACFVSLDATVQSYVARLRFWTYLARCTLGLLSPSNIHGFFHFVAHFCAPQQITAVALSVHAGYLRHALSFPGSNCFQRGIKAQKSQRACVRRHRKTIRRHSTRQATQGHDTHTRTCRQRIQSRDFEVLRSPLFPLRNC